MASYLINPTQYLFDANGKPVSGGKIYVYDAGTTTKIELFTDSALTVAAANPIVTDSAGRYAAPFFTNGDFKIVITDASNVPLSYPGIDNFSTFVTSVDGALAVADGGTGSTTAEDARTALDVASAADVSTLSSAVTAITDQVDALPGGTLGDVAALDAVDITALDTGFADVCIKSARVSSSSITTVSTRVDVATTPTNANGTELLSLAFTPTRSDSELEFDAYINIEANDGDTTVGVVYLCRSDSANALQLAYFRNEANGFVNIKLNHRFSLGTTDAITYSIRAANRDTGDSFTMNSTSWGGISKSSLRIRELVTTPVS